MKKHSENNQKYCFKKPTVLRKKVINHYSSQGFFSQKGDTTSLTIFLYLSPKIIEFSFPKKTNFAAISDQLFEKASKFQKK